MKLMQFLLSDYSRDLLKNSRNCSDLELEILTALTTIMLSYHIYFTLVFVGQLPILIQQQNILSDSYAKETALVEPLKYSVGNKYPISSANAILRIKP